ncbi:MAG: hypothetical protein SFT68_01660 [Rickettsiaceae bacterium]|nr:hypothetical protein [Rickettsiaceae bacterium]
MTRHRESFPRRRESSLTISWIPFYKGMTRGQICHSLAPYHSLDPLLQGDDLKITYYNRILF